MKKLKENKGITLVALIITIIVLLILAVVAISAVQGDGIIAHAKNARENYQRAQGEENTVLGNYMITLENVNNKESTKNSITNENIKFNVCYGSAYKNISDLKNKCLNEGISEEIYNLIDFTKEYIPLYYDGTETEEVTYILFEDGSTLFLCEDGEFDAEYTADNLEYLDNKALKKCEPCIGDVAFEFKTSYAIIYDVF